VEAAGWKEIMETRTLKCQNVLIPEEVAAEGKVMEERREFFWALHHGLTVISPRLQQLEEIGIFADEHYIEMEAGDSVEQLAQKVSKLSEFAASNGANIVRLFTTNGLADKLAPIILSASNEKKGTPWTTI
jgi:hypothetical protein